ncbi:type VI secretion system protein TssA [Pirellulaceae bacterium SH467]
MTEEFLTLLTPIAPDQPSGVDLEYDPDFSAMEKASQGTSDQEYGSTVIEGAPPDWALVRQLAMKLLQRSKDLRVASLLVQAELELRGLLGMRDSLGVIAEIVTQFWETCFPLLDPDDDNDPTIRINALLSLTKPGGVLRQVRTCAIAKSRSVGLLSLQDVMIAKGEMVPPAGMDDPPTLKKVEAIFRSGNLSEHRELLAAVEESIALLKKIEEGFSSQVGMNDSPDFDPLLKELRAISKTQTMWIANVTPSDEASASGSSPDEGGNRSESHSDFAQGEGSKPAGGTGKLSVGSLQISSRSDAIECLAKIIAWFENYEPSSPLPMLLRRARKLSTMSFLDILRDISPDGINQAMLVGGSGVEDEEPSSPSAPAPAPERREEKPNISPPPPHDRY